MSLLRRWYDFLVEHDELLLDPAVVDVTGAWAGAFNDAVDVAFDSVAASDEPEAGTVWIRVTQAGRYLVVHLINLAGQDDTVWDEPRQPVRSVGPATLRVRRAGAAVPASARPTPIAAAGCATPQVRVDGEFAVATLPEPHVWQIVTIDLDPS